MKNLLCHKQTNYELFKTFIGKEVRGERREPTPRLPLPYNER